MENLLPSHIWKEEPFKSIAEIHITACELTLENHDLIPDEVHQSLHLSACANELPQWKKSASALLLAGHKEFNNYDRLIRFVADGLMDQDTIEYYLNHMRENPGIKYRGFFFEQQKHLVPCKAEAWAFYKSKYDRPGYRKAVWKVAELGIKECHLSKVPGAFPEWRTIDKKISERTGSSIKEIKRARKVLVHEGFMHCRRRGYNLKDKKRARRLGESCCSIYEVFLSEEMSGAFFRCFKYPLLEGVLKKMVSRMS